MKENVVEIPPASGVPMAGQTKVQGLDHPAETVKRPTSDPGLNPVWLAASSVADVLIASVLAVVGLAMTPLPALVVGGTLAAAAAFALVLDAVKVPGFRRLRIAQRNTATSMVNALVGVSAKDHREQDRRS